MSPVQVRPPLLESPLVCERVLHTATLVSRTIHTAQRKALAVAKATDIRPKITMACVDCRHRNYITKKNRRNDPDRIELKKFCPNCGKHTAHRETR